jgi:hypothetical protein
MATKPPTTTRRALLGAAAALPIAALASPASGVAKHPGTAKPPFAPSETPHPACLERSRETQRWNHRLARYTRLATSAKKAAETGWFRAANDRYNRECAAPDPTHPEEGLSLSKAGLEGRQAAFARVTRAENLYYDRHAAPLYRAATLLAETPAPDLPSLLAKIRVMQAHELQEDGALPVPALSLLVKDAERLIELDHPHAVRET